MITAISLVLAICSPTECQEFEVDTKLSPVTCFYAKRELEYEIDSTSLDYAYVVMREAHKNDYDELSSIMDYHVKCVNDQYDPEQFLVEYSHD